MDNIENITDAIGIDGKQATLPKLSVTHLEEDGSFHGSVSIPLIIRYRRMISWMGASNDPQIDFIS